MFWWDTLVYKQWIILGVKEGLEQYKLEANFCHRDLNIIASTMKYFNANTISVINIQLYFSPMFLIKEWL